VNKVFWFGLIFRSTKHELINFWSPIQWSTNFAQLPWSHAEVHWSRGHRAPLYPSRKLALTSWWCQWKMLDIRFSLVSWILVLAQYVSCRGFDPRTKYISIHIMSRGLKDKSWLFRRAEKINIKKNGLIFLKFTKHSILMYGTYKMVNFQPIYLANYKG
jgi:hypothetical protein